MAEILAKLFIKEYQNTKDPAVRAAYGELSGAVGIFVNLLLTAAKFCAGFLSGSISISADAVNNLSDAGSSIITLAGFKMAKKPAEKYFLSPAAMRKILSNLSPDRRDQESTAPTA